MHLIQSINGRNLIGVGQTVRTLVGGHAMTVVAIDCCGPELIATCSRRVRGHEVQDFYSVDDLERIPAGAKRTFKIAEATKAPGAAVPGVSAVFPREIRRPPRVVAGRVFTDLRHWTVMERGGHFAALEQPEALARDIADFFRPLR
jgi:hypothetical protein